MTGQEFSSPKQRRHRQAQGFEHGTQFLDELSRKTGSTDGLGSAFAFEKEARIEPLRGELDDVGLAAYRAGWNDAWREWSAGHGLSGFDAPEWKP